MEKRIIYCWFGGGEKSDTIKNCINSWKNLMPDFEILEINETNFDISLNEYVKKAYEQKKWAYVSDVARLWALYNYGGIYMDTDVMCYKSLDPFLKHDFFTGFESENYPVTALIGCNKGNWLVKEMLDIYENKKFEVHNNWWEYETNTMIMSDIIGKYIDRKKDEYQEAKGIVIYPSNYFCHCEEINEQTYAKHLMLGSWE